ncbi:MAG TPA: protein kinase, partial [Myxococcota bacterium]|nr:protein kinase [Myxococcota bacterium]
MEAPKAFGPFEVRGELGRGGSGVVFVGWDAESDRTAAIKLFNTIPKDVTGTISRVKRDAQAAGALGHPNVAAVLGVGDHEGWPWVATEFVPGVSLAQVLRGRSLLPIERVLDVWRQICEGLAHAHREGVLHLDLKPADVRLAPTGEVKLVDFGSWHLKALEHVGPLDAGLHYRAPELLIGRKPDHRADIFSVGAIVYELVAYRKAFPGDTSTDIVRGITRCEPDLACLPRNAFSPGFERVLAASLARVPDSRHASFEEVHADLVQLVRETAPRLREKAAEAGETIPPEREELLANVTRARAEDRLEDALDGVRQLLHRDSEDEAARRSMTEIESVLVDREVDALVGMALAYAADGQLKLATEIAEKVERLAPWSPRYLQLQVYLDEEGARKRADDLVARAREYAGAGRVVEAQAAVREALLFLPGHAPAARLSLELAEAAALLAAPAPEAAASAPPEPEAASSAAPSDGPLTALPLPEEPAEAEAEAGQAPAPVVATAVATPTADPRSAEAVALSAAALRHFLQDEH